MQARAFVQNQGLVNKRFGTSNALPRRTKKFALSRISQPRLSSRVRRFTGFPARFVEFPKLARGSGATVRRTV